jgi:hypothetical protein
VAGTTNTGSGGGGGGSGGGATDLGGNGGSGLVILRYSDTLGDAFFTSGSPTFTAAAGYKIYTFTGTGTITL